VHYQTESLDQSDVKRHIFADTERVDDRVGIDVIRENVPPAVFRPESLGYPRDIRLNRESSLDRVPDSVGEVSNAPSA
jgi:hypothetical protein